MLIYRPMVGLTLGYLTGVYGFRTIPQATWFPLLPPLLALGILLMPRWKQLLSFFCPRWRFQEMTPGSLEQDSSPGLSALHPSPLWPTRIGRERLLLILALLFTTLGWERQRLFTAGRLRDARALPSKTTFWARVEVVNPPEEALGEREQGRWRASGILERIEEREIRGIPVLLSGYGSRRFGRGDRLEGYVKILPSTPAPWPGAFDRAHYLEVRGAVAGLHFFSPRFPRASHSLPGRPMPSSSLLSSSSRPPPYIIHPAQSLSPLRYLDEIRAVAVRAVLRVLPGQGGAFVAAAIFGYKVELAEETQQRFQRTGVGHILAISGLHVGLVLGLAWSLFQRFCYDRRLVATLCLVVAFAYLILSGGRIPVFRATLMATVYLIGLILSRRSDLVNSLAVAALIILFDSPPALTDLGFQLSFVAVLFIACLGKELGLSPLDSKMTGGGPEVERGTSWLRQGGYLFLRRMWDLTVLSIVAWLGVMPLIAIAFGQISLAGLVANIIILPLMLPVIAGGLFLSVTSGFMAPYDVQVAKVVGFPVEVLLKFVDFMNQFSWASLPVALPSPCWLGCYYLGFGFFILRRAIASRRLSRIILATSLAMVGVSGIGMALDMRPQPPPPQTRISLLPGGKTETVVIERSNGEVVIVGPLARRGKDVATFLGRRGRFHIDHVMAWSSSPQKLERELRREISVGRFESLPWRMRKTSSSGEEREGDRERQQGALASRGGKKEKRNAWGGENHLQDRILFAGGEMRGFRDRKGRLLLQTITVDGMTVSSSLPCWPRELVSFLRQGDTHLPPDVCVAYLHRCRDPIPVDAPWFFVSGKKANDSQWQRERWGAIEISRNQEGTIQVRAYDGRRFCPIRPQFRSSCGYHRGSLKP